MKKILALVLAFVMCLSLCACGDKKGENKESEKAKEPNPFSQECKSIDEVVALFDASYKATKEQQEAILNNESITKYFKKEYVDDAIWKKLQESENSNLAMDDIHKLYRIGNSKENPIENFNYFDYDNWFDYLNIGDGTPFFHHSDSMFNLYHLENNSYIRNKFKNPDSVEFESAKIGYVLPEGITDPNGFTFFDEKIHYYLFAEIYATNSFGAKEKDVYCLQGNVPNTPYSISEFMGNTVQDAFVTAAFENNGCGHPWLIF